MKERNPQAEQMADESMLRNLAAQAEAIWPQEQGLFERYELPAAARIADIGCGSGEITSRLAARYPEAGIVGVDILEGSVSYARRRYASLAPRVRFEQGDAFELHLPASQFDLVVCRHMTQAVPEPQKVLAELRRICRPGGWVHVLSEDYGMIHLPRHPTRDLDRFWLELPLAYLAAIGCDGRIGRHTPALLAAEGFEAIRLDYVVVDTLRVPRATFAGILRAWGDGFSAALAEATGRPHAQVQAQFEAMAAALEHPAHYGAWHVPIVSARKPVA